MSQETRAAVYTAFERCLLDEDDTGTDLCGIALDAHVADIVRESEQVARQLAEALKESERLAHRMREYISCEQPMCGHANATDRDDLIALRNIISAALALYEQHRASRTEGVR